MISSSRLPASGIEPASAVCAVRREFDVFRARVMGGLTRIGSRLRGHMVGWWLAVASTTGSGPIASAKSAHSIHATPFQQLELHPMLPGQV